MFKVTHGAKAIVHAGHFDFRNDSYAGFIEYGKTNTSSNARTPIKLNTICGNDVIMCNATLGKVGIGVNSPAYKLQVNNGNIMVKGENNYTTVNDVAKLLLGDQYHYLKSVKGKGEFIKTWGNIDETDNNYIFLQEGTGNVGIGTPLTNNPNGYKLAVNGMIGAKELKIEINSTTWPDFVFDKKYKLMPLAELEKFLQKEKHLPLIPSSREVKENKGITLGEMSTLQLQKIEELTLYIIALNKKLQVLENKVAEMEGKGK